MSDPVQLIAAECFNNLCAPVYIADSLLAPYLFLRTFNQLLEYGLNGNNSYGIALIGNALFHQYNEPELGEQLVNLSIEIARKLKHAIGEMKALASRACCTACWVKPIGSIIEADMAFYQALRNGDLIAAAYILTCRISQVAHCAPTLHDWQAFVEFGKQINNSQMNSLAFATMGIQAAKFVINDVVQKGNISKQQMVKQ